MFKNGLYISDLNFIYPSWAGFESGELLSGLSLNIRPGELTVIFGAAESGKSTLALIIAALIPLHTGGEISGKVIFNGKDILGFDPAELIEDCGIIFQDPERQTVTTECFSEAAFALESLGVPEDKIRERVESSFDQLNIRRLLDSPVSETSGGEKKKLALAGLISVNPELWILDETVEELDNPSRIELLRILRDSGKTIILFTSKYFNAFSDADAFFLLKGGQLSAREYYPFERRFRDELVSEGVIPDFKSLTPLQKKSASGDFRRESLIRASKLLYRYEGGSFELKVDGFSLSENETVSIVGRNGCGKSTLAKILCGLIEPQTGEILIEEEGSASMNELNAFCAYMFQNPDYQIFLPTIYDELAWGLKEAGCSASVIRAKVEKAIEDFKLPDASTPPAMMSFSARKRLQAAVYYLLKRPVFILDEADTGLSFLDFIDLTLKLRNSCRGLIIITHNLELASFVSDRVLGMSGGRMYDNILDFSPERLNEWLSDSPDRDEAEL